RIAVMNAGKVEQIGTPRDIYDRPRTRFVCDFIGESNLFEGEWRDGVFTMHGKTLPAPKSSSSGAAAIAVRPERIRITSVEEAPIAGRVQASSFVSGQMNYRIVLDDGHNLVVVKEAAARPERSIGEVVGISWTGNDVVIL